MTLSDKQILFLRKKCHHLKPVVIIGGNGLRDSVMLELDNALAHHELVKVKINIGDKQERQQAIDTICDQTGATLIQTIGHTASFFRRADKPVIDIPRL